MEESSGLGFEDFAIEMEEFEVKKVKKHDRMWQVKEGGSICQIINPSDGAVYFGSLNKTFYAINSKDGRKLWQYKTDGLILESSPAVWEGKVYFGSYDHNMYCLDARTGKLIWKFRTNRMINAAPIIDNSRLYFGSTDHNMYCLDAKTGGVIWKFRTQEEVQSTPIIHEGRLFFGSFDHFFYCIDADSGSLIWKHQTQGEIYYFNPPLIHGGLIMFPSFDNLIRAVRIEDGTLMWKFRTGNYGCVCCPIKHDDRLYVSSRDGNLFCLTLDGKQMWKFTKNEPVSLPTPYNGRIYIGCEDQYLYCLDMEGKEVWKFKTQGVVWLKPVIYEDMVMTPSFDCHIYSLDPESGELIWKFRTEGDPSPLPPAYDAYEMVIKKSGKPQEKLSGRSKHYDFKLEDELNTSEYQSRITYQVSTQYAAKGKYQIDEKTEGF